MDVLLGEVAIALLALYVIFSFASALRMYFVHRHYVHVEYAGKKWRSYGDWAPRRYRSLTTLRWLVLAFIVLWIVALAV